MRFALHPLFLFVLDDKAVASRDDTAYNQIIYRFAVKK